MVRKSVLTIAALLAVGGVAMAQGPGMNMPPEARAKMEKWRTWRDNHKNFQQLSSTIRAISDMDQDPATKLTKDQAKKINAIITPWKSKPVMTDEQARTITSNISKVLNITQIKKYAAIQAEQNNRRGGMGGPGGGPPGGGFGGPPGGGPPGGGGGFGGGRPGGGPPGGGPPGGGGFDPSKMSDPKEYNPLNPATFPTMPFTGRQKQRLNDFLTLLKTRSA
jgi:hypothetical protein